MKQKLTVKSIKAIQPGEKDIIVWDTELAGFGVKVTPAGKRSFLLFYRTKDGQQRKPSIGVFGIMQPEAARELAKHWLSEVAHGRDPSLTRKESRSAPNVRELFERYLMDHAELRKKATSVRNDRRLIDTHLLPAIGARKVAAVTRTELHTLHHSLRKTPYEANRMLALASKAFSLAERWGLRPDGSNPAKNIDKFAELKRQRFLSAEELSRLAAVLSSPEGAKAASASSIAAIRLLLLTGRRLNEVLKLEWSMLDLDAAMLRLPDTKTGALTIALSEPAVELLSEIKTEAHSQKFVFPSRRKPKASITGKSDEAQAIVNIQKSWRKIRTLAQLENVRLHDLRHTYASVAAGRGIGLQLIGKLLGHTQVATTARYAHLAQEVVRAAVDDVGLELDRLMGRERGDLAPAASNVATLKRLMPGSDEATTRPVVKFPIDNI